MEENRILLHSCCGPCSSACIERLIPDMEISVYYYNPCIDDPLEYAKRRDVQKELIDRVNSGGGAADPETRIDIEGRSKVGFTEGPYDPERYRELVSGLEGEPEGGKRCEVCFRMRLFEAARYAAEHGFPAFTTTLTVSPHKNYDLISTIGREAGEKYGVEYIPYDFKKKDGFKRSVDLSKSYGLYRQDYCGCGFSRRDPGSSR